MSREFGLIQIKLQSQMSLVELSLIEQHYNYSMIKTKLLHSMFDNLALPYPILRIRYIFQC